MTGLAPYVASRGAAAVHLWASEAQATRLARDLAPYVPLAAAPDALPGDIWTIRPATPGDEGDIAITQPGLDAYDVGYRLWIRPATRTLALAAATPDAQLVQYRRLVRAILRRALLVQGAIHLQAALAVSRQDGSGTAILGPTRGGKTTLLLALLLSGQFAGCANDDLTAYAFTDTQPRGLGWPRAISMRRDTLRHFATAGSALRAALAEARHPNSGAAWGTNQLDHRAWLFPDELAHATASPLHAEAHIHRLVFLAAGDTPRPHLTRFDDADDVARRLRTHVEAAATKYEPWLDAYFAPPPPGSLDRRVLNLVHRTSAFRLTHSLASLPQSVALLARLTSPERPGR